MRRIVTAAVLLTLAASLNAQTVDTREPDVLRMESKIMGEPRIVLVRTPPSYKTGDRRYPVIYLTDGDAHLGHTAATVDFLAREGRMPQAIIVAVQNTDRTRDLTPTKVKDRAGETGGADKFLDFFEKELIPTIDSRYRTQNFRVFGGHSLGGLFALHGLFTRPKLFDAWISVSPSLPWDNRYLFRRGGEFFTKVDRNFATTLVVTVGDEGELMRVAFEEFRTLVRTRKPRGMDAQFIHFPDEDHGSVVMPSHYAALRKIFAPWHFTVPNDSSDAKRDHARAVEHYAKLSTRVGYTIPVPEPLTNVLGYRLLQANRTNDAIEILRTNVALFPNSANVHDSLGEAYEKAGQRDLARESYERAAKIGTETNDPNVAIFKRNAERMK